MLAGLHHYQYDQDTSSLLDWVAELDYLMHSTLKQLPDAVSAARSSFCLNDIYSN